MTLPVTIAAVRKIEMSPEKIDDARIWGRLQPPPPRLSGSYAYADVYTVVRWIKLFGISQNTRTTLPLNGLISKLSRIHVLQFSWR